MTQQDFAMMTAVLGGAFVLASFVMWRGKDSSADVGLMAGSGLAFGALAASLGWA